MSFRYQPRKAHLIPSTCTLSEKDWKLIQKILPPEIETGKGMKGGRPHADLRKIFVACCFRFDQDANGVWFQGILAAAPVLENI